MLNMKLCVMGDGGVGKTASTIQFVANHFVEYYDPTIEDSYKRCVQLEGCDMQFMCEILDTAGQEDFSPLRDSWIRESDGFLLVYSVTERPSLDYLDAIYRQITRTKDDNFTRHPMPIVLAGNKCDLDGRRQVSIAEAQQWAAARGITLCAEFSAKTRLNLTETFNSLVRVVGEKHNAFESKGKKKKRDACTIL